jgi:choline dehydrogenase-like flavoprotein
VGRLVVVGSGASGVHFALSALHKGHAVTMLDVGVQKPKGFLPDTPFLDLRTELDDPAEYFLGEAAEGVVYPGSRETYYGLPPSKAYIFERPAAFRSSTTGIEPSHSFARGGLAETWTAGAYEWNDDDLTDYPFNYGDLRPYYREAASRIGVGAADDDLVRFIPREGPYLPPLDADLHSEILLRRYARRRRVLHERHGFFMGRSRVATLSRDHRGRRGCSHLGRCLWGCPVEAIYSPLFTLRECQEHPRFDYRPDLFVRHFEYDDEGHIGTVVAEHVDTGRAERIEAGRVVLAAGALGSTRIVLASILNATGKAERVGGLMDNRQIHVPFLTAARMGKEPETAAYQFHHLAFGLVRDEPRAYVHGQITTLRSASLHPIVQSLPLDTKTALAVFRRLRAGLAVANVNLHDARREESSATVRQTGDGRVELVLDYVADPGETQRGREATRDVGRALRRLGCLVPPGMTRTLPKGASAHYAGTLPMRAERARLSTTPDCRSWDFDNLYVVDGAVLPFLPAKNHTFTLMANAIRVAERTLD